MSSPPNEDTFIPEGIGGEDILLDDAPFVGTVEFIDGVIVFLPSIIFLLVSDAILPPILESYAIFISILILMIGSSLLLVKPKYKTVYEWFTDYKNFYTRNKNKKRRVLTDGGNPIIDHDVVPDDDTRELTQVRKLHPHNNSIELTDGTIVGIIEFTGSNLDMASGQTVANVVQQYSRAVGSQLQSDIQFYMPMRKLSMRETAKVYAKQRAKVDPDGFMDAYLDDREDWVSGMSDGAYMREQYVVIPVTRREIYEKGSIQDSSSLEKLPAGELLADIKRGLFGSEIKSKQEVKRQQFRELSSRIDNISKTLTKGPGNSSSQVSSAKCVALLKEFWEGDDILSGEFESMIQEMPAVLGPEDATQGDNND